MGGIGSTARRALLGVIFGLMAAPAAQAEPLPADCAVLRQALGTLGPYRVTAAPQGESEGWCVMDRAKARSEAATDPDLDIAVLRLRGLVDGEALVAVDLELGGLRVRPKPEDRVTDERLKQLFRLQSADARLSARVVPGTGVLELRNVALTLSGGTELALSADVAGAGLSPVWPVAAELTALDLTWRSDGRLLRPVMEVTGERLLPGAMGTDAVDAARLGLRAILDTLPEAMVGEKTRDALHRLIANLPQERGRLDLSLTAPEGIGAAQLFLSGFADDPLAPATLSRLFAGARLEATWQPGLAP